MASSKLLMNTIDEARQDLISNLPAIVTEKVLKRLPLSMAAKMSVLSRKWKENYGIISSILFHHNGPIHKFHLYIPSSVSLTCIQLSQWLSFLSKTNVKKIVLIERYWIEFKSIPSHIFSCKELVKLKLVCSTLNPPPRDFNGFTNLRSLKLRFIKFKHSNMLASLIASCPRLIVLKLEHCMALDTVIIDIPSLERLVISGNLECLCLKSIVRLNNISLCLNEYSESDAVVLNSIRDLATSCQLQYLHFGGRLCKVLANTDVFQLKIDCDYRIDSNKLGHLTKVKFTGIKGSSAELKFMEYLLAISEVLELFLFKCENLDATSELKVSRDLLQLQRASTKAQLIYME